MGPYADSGSVTVARADAMFEEDERRLAAARESFPAWSIIETFGGYLAVPAGAVVVRATDLDGLVGKLREQG